MTSADVIQLYVLRGYILEMNQGAAEELRRFMGRDRLLLLILAIASTLLAGTVGLAASLTAPVSFAGPAPGVPIGLIAILGAASVAAWMTFLSCPSPAALKLRENGLDVEALSTASPAAAAASSHMGLPEPEFERWLKKGKPPGRRPPIEPGAGLIP